MLLFWVHIKIQQLNNLVELYKIAEISCLFKNVNYRVDIDKPSNPVGPLKAEEVRADHIKVAWKKPKDNGGSEITGYIIEKMEVDSGHWIPAGEVCDEQIQKNFQIMKSL